MLIMKGKDLGIKLGEKQASNRSPFPAHYLKTYKIYVYLRTRGCVLSLLPPYILESVKLESFSWLCMFSSITLATSVFSPTHTSSYSPGWSSQNWEYLQVAHLRSASLFCLAIHLLWLSCLHVANPGETTADADAGW